MSVFRELFNGATDLAKIGAAHRAQQEMIAKARREARAHKGQPEEGCTPCAAKKKAAEIYNTSPVIQSLWK